MTVEESKTTADITPGSENHNSKTLPAVELTKEAGYSSSLSGDDHHDGPVKTGESAFVASEDPRFYKPIDSYEGLHRWDPDFDWSEQEEKKIVRKIDLRVCTFACITFFALQLDRGNNVQANSDTLLPDLGMNTNDYDTGQTIFLVCFLFAEMPSQLISKKLGPDRWIPCQMICWSFVAAFQAFLQNKGGYFACRALLGLIEGGFIPDTILFLSYFYKSRELTIRLSYFWTSYYATSIVGAFLAFGFLHVHDSSGKGGWRYLFAFEGLITGVIGIIAVFWMPASPTQTKGGFRGKTGWFNEHEEKIMVNRVLRDDPSKGSMHNRQAITPKLFWEALCDYDMWPIYFLGLIFQIPTTPATNYITLQLKNSLGFSTFQTNLLTIPAYVLCIINVLFFAWLSERVNQRLLMGIVTEVWSLALLIALEVLPDEASPWARWAILTLLVGTPYTHAIIVAMTSRNAGSVRTRTVASALYNMSVQVSTIIGNNVYREQDKPYYRTGNKVLIALAAVSLVLFILVRWYYVWRNKTNTDKWNAMTTEQKEAYLATHTDASNKRLDFLFTH